MNALTNGFTISNGTITKHSLTDYGLAVNNTNYIGDPNQETFYVDVIGRNGLLDLSEAVSGRPIFKDRTLTIKVGGVNSQFNWDGVISSLRNNFEGRKCKIIFDNDLEWYWEGRVYIKNFQRNKCIGTFTIEMIADAFKYKVTPTVDTYTCSNVTLPVTIRNTYIHPVTPVFTCTNGTMTITATITGISTPMTFSLSSGQSTEIAGLNSMTTNMSVTVGTTGTMQVKWREASL